MIRRDLKNMKKRRAAICFLMVFIMSFTLLPSGVFAAQNDSLKAKQQLAEQSRKFDEDKEKQKEESMQSHQTGFCFILSQSQKMHGGIISKNAPAK